MLYTGLDLHKSYSYITMMTFKLRRKLISRQDAFAFSHSPVTLIYVMIV